MKTTLKPRLSGKGNVITDTVKYIKREVGAVEDKIEARAQAIAIRSAITGGAIGVVIGIVGMALWEKYMTPSTPAPRTTV